MFGVGLFEMLVIGLAILIFFGPQKLPELAQQLGKFYVQLRRMTSDVRNTFDEAMRKAEHDLLIEERNKLQALIQEQSAKQASNTESTKEKEEPLAQPTDRDSVGASEDGVPPKWDHGASKAESDTKEV